MVSGQPDIFDPAISKIGVLLPGQVGLVGENLEWIITVSNNSNVSLTNVVVVDTIIPQLQVDSVSNNVSGNTTINGQVVTLTIPVLNVGESITYSIFTTVLESTASVSNTVCMTSTNVSEICSSDIVNLTLATITELPATGETPLWRTILLSAFLVGIFFISVVLGRVKKQA